MTKRIKFRRNNEGMWRSKNPILLEGEMGISKNTHTIVIGNGVSPWIDIKNDVTYLDGGNSVDSYVSQAYDGGNSSV